MRLAIFSDIHGNDIAFEAVVNDAGRRGADMFLIAGDMVSDYPLASQAIRRARALTPYVVKGNRDSYFERFYTQADAHWKEYKQFAGMLWSFGHMCDEDFRYIASLPGQLEIPLEGGVSVMMTHYIPDVEAYMATMPQRVLVCGHTHRPRVLRHGDKLFVNPGSVGINMSVGFRAEYMLLDISEDGGIETEVVYVPYEKQRVWALLSDLSRMGEEAAADWFRLLYATQESGFDYMSELFRHAERIKAERGYTCRDTPNEIWDELILMFRQGKLAKMDELA